MTSIWSTWPSAQAPASPLIQMQTCKHSPRKERADKRRVANWWAFCDCFWMGAKQDLDTPKLLALVVRYMLLMINKFYRYPVGEKGWFVSIVKPKRYQEASETLIFSLSCLPQYFMKPADRIIISVWDIIPPDMNVNNFENQKRLKTKRTLFFVFKWAVLLPIKKRTDWCILKRNVVMLSKFNPYVLVYAATVRDSTVCFHGTVINHSHEQSLS